jgi:uncharacterized protein YjbI with pentapeptide repeats
MSNCSTMSGTVRELNRATYTSWSETAARQLATIPLQTGFVNACSPSSQTKKPTPSCRYCFGKQQALVCEKQRKTCAFAVRSRAQATALLRGVVGPGPQPESGESQKRALAALFVGLCLMCGLPKDALAISGGGLDYAGQQLSEQDLSHRKLSQKDFSGSTCRKTNFSGSDLSGARFFKADLTEANFENAQLIGASLEQTVLRGSNFQNAVLRSTYWTESVLTIANIENTDWTDALLEPTWQMKLCSRSDAKGMNTLTNTDTRESLMCPD